MAEINRLDYARRLKPPDDPEALPAGIWVVVGFMGTVMFFVILIVVFAL